MFPDFLWKAEILTGVLPAKTSQFSDKSMRKNIIYLFGAIEKVKIYGMKREYVTNILSKYSYILDDIASRVYYLDRKGEKTSLVFFSYNKPRFLKRFVNNKIYIFIPTNLDNDEW